MCATRYPKTNPQEASHERRMPDLRHPARRETPRLFAEHGLRGRKAGRAADDSSRSQDPCAESSATAVARRGGTEGRRDAMTSSELVVPANRPNGAPTVFDYSTLASDVAE